MTMSKEDRRASALTAGVKLAKKVGAARVSVAAVAVALKVTPPLLFHIFGSTVDFRKAVEKQAKKDGVVLPTAAPTVRESLAKVKKVVITASKKPVIKTEIAKTTKKVVGKPVVKKVKPTPLVPIKKAVAVPAVATKAPVVKRSSVAAATKFAALPTPAVMLAK